MNKKLLIAVVLAVIASYAGLQPATEKTAPASSSHATTSSVTHAGSDIAELTRQQRVVSYLQQHQKLPSYYLHKNEAMRQGWEPAKGNLCQVLPGKAIGGDHFGNREGNLPVKAGRNWYEADVNYRCGRRGSERLLWSNDGLIYVSHDHYRHVERVQ